jgi:hypothetical protein
VFWSPLIWDRETGRLSDRELHLWAGPGRKQEASSMQTEKEELKNVLQSWGGSRAWWRTPLIPALGRQRQADFWVRGQPGLQSEFQDSQGYTEKPCLEKRKKKKKKKTKLRWEVRASSTRLKFWYFGGKVKKTASALQVSQSAFQLQRPLKHYTAEPKTKLKVSVWRLILSCVFSFDKE